MKTVVISLSALLVSLLAISQPMPAPYGPVPTEGQLRWHEMEMYCLIHFGANTYLDHEWGYGDEDPKLIDPVRFDASQIVGAARAGGFKGVIIVAKHHDGLCLWPTATTEHNISKSSWKGGKGDIMQEYREACDRLGMQLGVYCSPWDRNNPAYGKAAYLDIYRRQLKELYSRYGKLFMSWHDGANGGNGYYGGAKENRNIDRTTYYDWDSTWNITRTMQPNAVIFGDVGPDVRWVGNEEGHAGPTCWATYTPHAPDAGKKAANGYVRSEEGTMGERNGQFWMPAECDVPLRPGWFYHASQDAQVKTPAALLDLYYASVGRGACLDLGLAPDKDGLMNAADVTALKGFGDLLKATFAVNLANGAHMQASNIRGGNATRFGPALLLDKDRYSCWITDDSVRTPSLVLDLGTDKTFNVIRLRENIKLGQRISACAIDIMQAGVWKEAAKVTSIGSNRLIRLDSALTTAKVRLRITDAPVSIALSDFGLYREPERIKAPVIKRNRLGMVTITGKTAPVYYTLDGTPPTPKSPVYRKPFMLTEGGAVKAAGFSPSGLPGDQGTAVYGISPAEWTVIDAPQDSHPELAIDENETTNWNTLSSRPAGRTPLELAVDMGKPQSIKAFTYLPRLVARSGEGLVDRYAFYVSDDGVQWKQAVKGEFSNIRANPVRQTVALPSAVTARYFKFSALHYVGGMAISVAEIGIIVK